MLVRKADFIADELPTIENQIVKLETRIDELHKSEKVLSQKLTQSVSYVDYENLVTELTQKYERMGSLKNVNLQFVASILSDKLPKGLKNDRYIIVKLSQKDKLFKF